MLIPLIPLSKSGSQDQIKDDELKCYIRQLGYLGPVILQSQNALDAGAYFPFDNVAELADCYVEGHSARDIESAVKMLDKGVQLVFFTHIDTEDFIKDQLASLPKSRIGLSSLEMNASIDFINTIVGSFGIVADNFLFKISLGSSFDEVCALFKHSKSIVASQQIKISFLVPAYDSAQLATLSIMSEAVHVVFEPSLELLTPTPVPRPSNLVPSVPVEHTVCSPYSNHLSTGAASDKDVLVEFLAAYIARLRSDRADGLFTTVVCDEQGICLGLVYSNAESIRQAVSQGRGVFWSRSRGGLWIKGETSGMWQELRKIEVDCDNDALRFTVKQRGDPPSFCHLMTRSCWGEARGVQKLEALLLDRKKQAPAGSYTKRLFDDPTLLRKKLLEEVQELVEATDPDHVAAEAADVLYFTMTRCVAAGVGLTDIEAHLEKRSWKVTRRAGDAKDWRTAAAEQALGKST